MSQRPLTTLKYLRQSVGATQTDLARAINKTQPDISWYEGELDRLPPDVATKILTVLRTYRNHGIDSRIRPEDLGRPWNEVLLGLHEAQKASA